MQKNNNKQTKHSISISNALIQSEYPILPTVDSHRILQLALSNVCKNLHNNKDDEYALKTALIVSLETESLEKLFPSFKKAGNIHERIDKATNIILRNNFIETKKDAGNFKKTALIENIEYVDYQKIEITFFESTRKLFNPESKFTRYVINNTAKLSTYQQIRIYELCYQYIIPKYKYRTIDIPTFKKFVGIEKNKTNSKLIEELKASIIQINKKTNLEISFETIKTGRKITRIKFIFCRTDVHPLDEINNKENDLKTQLIELGFKPEKLKSLSNIPVEVLIQAISATQKAKDNGFKKSMEACFFYQVGILKDNNDNKLTPSKLVSMFKENTGIKKVDLWNEFYAQLSKEQQAAYSQTNRERNKTVKEALDKDFNSKFNRWIYETKVNNKILQDEK